MAARARRPPTTEDAASIVAGMQSEKEFQQNVIRVARLANWLVYHTHDSRHSAAGFPDLVLCPPFANPPRQLLFRELKAEKGVVSADQLAWLDALAAAGENAAVWKPSDWPLIREVFGCVE